MFYYVVQGCFIHVCLHLEAPVAVRYILLLSDVWGRAYCLYIEMFC